MQFIGMIASHADHMDRVVALRRCLRSIRQQQEPLLRLYISCSGLMHGEAAQVIAEETHGMAVSSFHSGQRRSQFEHFRALIATACFEDALNHDTYILFGDDDDVWHPDRVAIYKGLVGSTRSLDGLSLEWAAMPRTIEVGLADSTSIDNLLQGGLASVNQMSVYFMIACKLGAVREFFEVCPPSLVESKFCDIAFKNYMLERMQTERVKPHSHEGRSLIEQGRWLIYYNNELDDGDCCDAEEVALRDWSSPSAFFRGNGDPLCHASDIRSCSPEHAEYQVVARELPKLQRLNSELANRGPDLVARHLARHRARIEKEGAGWFGRSRPPSRSEVETLFTQIELGRGGTSSLAALIGEMQRQAQERSKHVRSGSASGLIRRSYVSYDDLAELEKSLGKFSAQEQAVAFDCLLLRAAQPLRKILQRFGMDTRPADLFEEQLERTWHARCQHLLY